MYQHFHKNVFTYVKVMNPFRLWYWKNKVKNAIKCFVTYDHFMAISKDQYWIKDKLTNNFLIMQTKKLKISLVFCSYTASDHHFIIWVLQDLKLLSSIRFWDYCTLAGAKNTPLFMLGAAAPHIPLTPHIM